jgi:signal transduction histidine kinase
MYGDGGVRPASATGTVSVVDDEDDTCELVRATVSRADDGRLLRRIGWAGGGVAAVFSALVAALELAMPGREQVLVRVGAVGLLVAMTLAVSVTVLHRLARMHAERVESARLAGVRLVARTAEHELNNRLALTVGYAELLADHPDLPPALRELAQLSLRGAERASETVKQLASLQHVREADWGPRLPPTLVLAPESPPEAVAGVSATPGRKDRGIGRRAVPGPAIA